jgi:hypothetical protein
MSTKTEEVHERAHDDDRPLPSARMDAAAERLKAEKPETAPAEKGKRTKAPTYMVLRAETDEHDGLWALLTPGPIPATSRKNAISKVAPKMASGPLAEDADPDRFVVILADQWTEITRALKPLVGFEEVFS